MVTEGESLSHIIPFGIVKGMIVDIGWSDEELRRLGLAR
jgi:hypothetical protein